MTSIAYRTTGRSFSRVPGDALSGVKRKQRQYRTTTTERLLLMAMIVLTPLEPSLPNIAGFTTPYIMFAILAGYILWNRPGALARTWIHPVFLAAFTLLIIASLIESAHPLSRYSHIFGIGRMIVGAIVVASLCRDRRALRAAVYGYLIAGVSISVLLFLTSYSALQLATATDFGEASRVRGQVVGDVQDSLRGLALSTTLGAVVALALGLSARSSPGRNLFFGIALFCVVATFLPMSRTGFVMLGISCATVMFTYGVRHVRVILVATALAVGALIWVPGVVYSRLTFGTETSAGRMDSRMTVYKAALDHLPEYVLTGVGAGNFWGPWGMQSGYYVDHGDGMGGVRGAHNGFIQVTINWGLMGLLMFILVIYLAYRCLPKGGGKDALALCLYGIAISLLLQLMAAHPLAEKQYSLGLGLLVGGHRWIWPKGIILAVWRRQSRRYHTIKHVS